jgi:hypothetical protein
VARTADVSQTSASCLVFSLSESHHEHFERGNQTLPTPWHLMQCPKQGTIILKPDSGRQHCGKNGVQCFLFVPRQGNDRPWRCFLWRHLYTSCTLGRKLAPLSEWTFQRCIGDAGELWRSLKFERRDPQDEAVMKCSCAIIR